MLQGITTVYFCSSYQELREMVNLPNTRADMLPTDFEGIAEALKGKNMSKHVRKTDQRVLFT